MRRMGGERCAVASEAAEVPPAPTSSGLAVGLTEGNGVLFCLVCRSACTMAAGLRQKLQQGVSCGPLQPGRGLGRGPGPLQPWRCVLTFWQACWRHGKAGEHLLQVLSSTEAGVTLEGLWAPRALGWTLPVGVDAIVKCRPKRSPVYVLLTMHGQAGAGASPETQGKWAPPVQHTFCMLAGETSRRQEGRRPPPPSLPRRPVGPRRLPPLAVYATAASAASRTCLKAPHACAVANTRANSVWSRATNAPLAAAAALAGAPPFGLCDASAVTRESIWRA